VHLVTTGRVVEWRGPAPFSYLPLSAEQSADVREVAALATYGWGVIPVVARVGDVEFTTSLFPEDGRHLLPLKAAVRAPQGITTGDEVMAEAFGPQKLTVISVPGVSLPARELQQLGVARVSTGPFTQRVALTALQDAAAAVVGGGTLPEGTRALN